MCIYIYIYMCVNIFVHVCISVAYVCLHLLGYYPLNLGEIFQVLSGNPTWQAEISVGIPFRTPWLYKLFIYIYIIYIPLESHDISALHV